MSKSKLIKKIFMEVFQWLAFATPVFVTGQRLATVHCETEDNCPGDDNTEYWLFVAGVISYVAGITLVAWLPVKIFIVWKKVIRPHEGLWFPGNLLYILFSAAPCVALILLGHHQCEDQNCFDYFRGAPIETFVIMLVVTDWSEKIRYINLRSDDDTMKKNKYTSASLDNRRSSKEIVTTNVDSGDAFGRVSISHMSLLHQSARNGTFRQKLGRSMKWTDARPENLLRDLMLAYDAQVLLNLSLLGTDEEDIFRTTWLYPIYILGAVSFIPLILAPNSKMRSCATVFLQDIPFFIFRVAIFSYFGSQLVLKTSNLFLLKNFFVTLAFFYFNVILPRRNDKQRRHEYELRRMSEHPNAVSNGEIGTVAEQRVDAPTHNTEVIDRHQYATDKGIANPAYQSKRYNSPPGNRRRHSATSYDYSSPELRRQESSRSRYYNESQHHGLQRQYSRRDPYLKESPSQRRSQYSKRNRGYQDLRYYAPQNQPPPRNQEYEERPPVAQSHAVSNPYEEHPVDTRGQPSVRYKYQDEATPGFQRKPSVRDHFQGYPNEWDDQHAQHVIARPPPFPEPVMYASHHTAYSSQPQATVVESITHQIPNERVALSTERHQQHLGYHGQQHQTPAHQESQEPKVINYDTLNDPGSFLYSQDRVQKKIKVSEIEFERDPLVSTSAQSLPMQRNSEKEQVPMPESSPSTIPPLSSAESNRITEEASAENEREKQNKPAPEFQPQEPAYAQVDMTRKVTRRKAPPPPKKSKSSAQIEQSHASEIDLPPPPPPEALNYEEIPFVNGDVNHDDDTKYEPTARDDTKYTPSLARALAAEALQKKQSAVNRREEMEAIKALDEATDHGSKIGKDWSVSTTPKSTHSAKQTMYLPATVNDDDYDERL